jgi:hypothetical protein
MAMPSGLGRRRLRACDCYDGGATQPVHVSVHFYGWGDFPNPNGYTQSKIHAHFEGAFIRQNVNRVAVAAGVASFVDCNCTIEDRTRMLILSSLAQVEPLYQLEKEGGFRKGDQFRLARKPSAT